SRPAVEADSPTRWCGSPGEQPTSSCSRAATSRVASTSRPHSPQQSPERVDSSMPPDPVRIAETKSWLVKAARDLRAADHEWSATPPLRDDIAFHCQQAVEKSLKAFLTWHDVVFRKTHDLIELGQGVPPRSPDGADAPPPPLLPAGGSWRPRLSGNAANRRRRVRLALPPGEAAPQGLLQGQSHERRKKDQTQQRGDHVDDLHVG